MKELNGSDLAGFIKARQAKQVRRLRQANQVIPKLQIIRTPGNPVIDIYVRLKKRYGADILVEVACATVAQADIASAIQRANRDKMVHGIILQLPIDDMSQVDGLLDTISPQKDVDGLSSRHYFTPATALAIDWLLSGYNIELTHKAIAIVGAGRLVGWPLHELWTRNGLRPNLYDDHTTDLAKKLQQADIVVTATGVPHLITSAMVKPGAIIVDAGTASESGQIVGDVDAAVRARADIRVTPVKGGVGPLTVAALFDNVLQAAERSAIANSVHP